MISLILYVLHFWLLNLFFQCFFETNKNRNIVHKLAIWSGFFGVQLFVINYFTNALTVFVCNCCSTFILSFLLYHATLKKKIFVSIASCTIGMLIEIIVSFTLLYLNYLPEKSSILGAILSKLFMLSLVHGISIFKRQRRKNNPSIFTWILLIAITVSSVVIIYTLYLFNQNDSSIARNSLTFISMLLLLLINISFFVFEDKLSKSTDMKIENLIMSQQVKRYEELRSNKEDQLYFFKREKHNLKNQLLSIRAYALKEDNSAIITFINKLLNESDFGLTPVSVSDNLVIDAIISSKLTLAQKNNIEYTWDINVPFQLPVNDIDLCILIGNSIENAFDACLASECDCKFLHSTIDYKQNCLYFNFKNSYSHQLRKVNNSLLSTKSNPALHGYGLPSIQSIVDKYNGILEIEHIENVFSLKIILYLS